MTMDDSEDVEPSLDQLSQAFAAAMGREKPSKQVDSTRNSSVSSSSPSNSQARTITTQRATAPADPCPISPKSILEAILFVGHPDNEPVSAARVASLLRGVKSDEIHDLVKELNLEYDEQLMPFVIQAAGDGYYLDLRPELQSLRERFYGTVREAKLSQHAVDILAVVAYRQPITREDLEKLLSDGRATQRILTQLVRRDLLERRKSEQSPNQFEFRTTDRFLDLFQLRDLGDLPRTEDPQ